MRCAGISGVKPSMVGKEEFAGIPVDNNNNNIIFIQVKLVQLQCAVINQGPVKPNYNRK